MVVAKDNFPCPRRLNFREAIEQGLDSKGFVSKGDEGGKTFDFCGGERGRRARLQVCCASDFARQL
jgi:hypothetical protein